MAESTEVSAHQLAVQELIDCISEISEEAYCASWMDAVEFALWRRMCEGPGRYGRAQIDQARIQMLRDLSQRCGGWVYWNDETDETFIPMREWEELYDEWRRRVRRPDGDY